jgi:actin-related protein 4
LRLPLRSRRSWKETKTDKALHADEVSALVLDPGYSAVRTGFAGEDTPKSIVPSYYAYANGKRLFGDHVIDLPRDDVDIRNPMSKDGTVEDWEAAEELWKDSFAAKLTGVRPNRALGDWLNDPSAIPNLRQSMADAVDTERCLEEHPLFMTEPSWNPTRSREKCTEIAMESWSAPAFYLGRQGVMASFAQGRATSLIIDIGASTMSVTPVHDGHILKKGVTKSNLAGNFLSSQVRNMFAANQPNPITITPHYMVKSKQPVDAGQPANVAFKTFPDISTDPRASFKRFQEDKVIQEFKEVALQAWTQGPFRGQGEAIARDRTDTHKPFEFPDGYNQLFSSDRFKIVETLFDPQCYIAPQPGSIDASEFPAPEHGSTIVSLVKQSIGQVDVDIRPQILMNVVLVGGSSLVEGLPQKLHDELTRMYPSTRVRITASGIPVERKFASWIGGSIMSSLGSFHQMWISKKEYDEHGPSIVEKRCK